jgi:signal transduction histidine kinase
MTNVRKHAQASEVTLGLRVNGGHATLTVVDNGVGFEAGRKVEGLERRHGIVGMRERARLLGGTLRVTSRPGNGTRVNARVPLGPSAREDGA